MIAGRVDAKVGATVVDWEEAGTGVAVATIFTFSSGSFGVTDMLSVATGVSATGSMGCEVLVRLGRGVHVAVATMGQASVATGVAATVDVLAGMGVDGGVAGSLSSSGVLPGVFVTSGGVAVAVGVDPVVG